MHRHPGGQQHEAHHGVGKGGTTLGQHYMRQEAEPHHAVTNEWEEEKEEAEEEGGEEEAVVDIAHANLSPTLLKSSHPSPIVYARYTG